MNITRIELRSILRNIGELITRALELVLLALGGVQLWRNELQSASVSFLLLLVLHAISETKVSQ